MTSPPHPCDLQKVSPRRIIFPDKAYPSLDGLLRTGPVGHRWASHSLETVTEEISTNTRGYTGESCRVSLVTSPAETTQDSLEPLNVSPTVAS